MVKRDDITEKAIMAWGDRQYIAEECSIKPQNISMWGKIPAKYVRRCSIATGIPPHKIRPDLPEFFPPPVEGHEAA